MEKKLEPDRYPLFAFPHKIETNSRKNFLFKSFFFLTFFTLFATLTILYFENRQNFTSARLFDQNINKLEKLINEISKNETHLFDEPQCSNIRDEAKYDCNPDRPSNEDTCIKRGCCWRPLHGKSLNDPPGIPYCYYPTNYTGYKIVNIVLGSKITEIYLKRGVPSGIPNDIQNLKVTLVQHQTALEIKITDRDAPRYESLYPKLSPPSERTDEPKLYNVDLTPSGRLTVLRAGTDSVLFQTELSQLVYADQLLQLTTTLPSANVYGLPEHMERLRLNTSWKRYSFLNSDLAPVWNQALYGAHPFYLVLESCGANATGVALINSNIMDVILQPAPAITFRPIGGILHFLILPGKSSESYTAPHDVSRKLTAWIGRPELPPYWSLGFHLCRFGYKTLNNTAATLERNRNANIPVDVQWNDIDYMVRQNDFTYDPARFEGLPQFVEQLHRDGLHYVIITDPGISGGETPGTYPPYDDGLRYNVFLKNSSGQLLIGKVWNPKSTVYPDFTHPNITDYWTKQIADFHSQVGFDGLWIDMNEPSNFVDGSIHGCPNTGIDHPPYLPQDTNPIYHKTACMSAQHYAGLHYNLHNLYGIAEAQITNIALRNVTGKRPFIISRSTFLGQGYYSGHWTGDVFSTWEDLRLSIPAILHFGMVGIPMVGADICGFNGNTTAELCARWSALGAFYPFSRNHNTDDGIDQDPVALGPNVAAAARNALMKRYFMLPYLYSQFVLATMYGDVVPRPLFYEFPSDPATYDIDSQFLLGPAVMVMPALYQGQTQVEAYFPAGLWYDFESQKVIASTAERVTLDAPIDHINIAIRGGHILPCQVANLTTTSSRTNPFVLLVALDNQSSAVGELFLDDGESLDTYNSPKGNWSHINFVAANNTLMTIPASTGYRVQLPDLKEVVVLGLQVQPTSVEVNGEKAQFQYNPLNKSMLVSLSLNLLSRLNTIEWIY